MRISKQVTTDNNDERHGKKQRKPRLKIASS